MTTSWYIENALIVNGDGMTPAYEGDLALEGDRVVEIGSVSPTAKKGAAGHIDAAGRVIAPSFVDTHNHGSLAGTRPGPSGLPVACEMSLRGGVTKRICGVDGLSPAPVAPDQRAEYAAQLEPLDGSIGEPWSWSSVEGFYDWHRGRSATDMGLYLGHSAVRRMVMGNEANVATDQQIREMQAVVRAEARATLGLSTGLVYNPAVYSDSRELTALVAAFNSVKPGALFPHLRNESDGIVEALIEVVTTAIEGGGDYCNEHSKIAGERNWGEYERLEAVLADASSTCRVMENMYPYPAGSTTGDAIFPPDIRAGGRAEFLARLGRDDVREAIYRRMLDDTKSWDNFVDFCGGLEGVQISGVRSGVGDVFLGMRLGDVARQAGFDDLESFGAFGAVFDFFVDNHCEVSIITHYGNDATVERFFRRPTMAICTDGLVPGPGQKPHPRTIGAFPKALRMARELGIGRREIVHRLATLPCDFLRLPSPVLRPGADASIVMFDWGAVGERNSYEDPSIPPDGIDAVWVHGQLLLDHGSFNLPDVLPGRILRTDDAGAG